MSFQFNSDNERISGVNPSIYGSSEFTLRTGSGAAEREIFRAQLNEQGAPRIGVNRTGRRVEKIIVDNGGSDYTQPPTVEISSPTREPFIPAQASASVVNGKVVSISVDNPGDGYEIAPTVTFDGGGGAGASATASLDSIEFEFDINGAIRTSTSVISDTARILNLDIDNFVTPDANFRAPNLKLYSNNTGTQWAPNVQVAVDQYRWSESNIYQVTKSGVTANPAPEHVDGIAANGTAEFKHVGFRIIDPEGFGYNTSGDGVFPRSITPLLGDKSDKIATTEYVLNLATNDVGGRVYVSEQIGNDDNDGRSAVAPVRTIKKACQIAWSTPGVKETVIVSGGNYVEDNPISIPPDCSIVGDNLRLVIVRPANLAKHVFKFGDKNYVTGITFRDQVDSNGDVTGTWDFAMVFDDKQRIYYDAAAGGEYPRSFPIGHQIFGPPKIELTFQNNTGLSDLRTTEPVRGLNTGSKGNLSSLSFTNTTGPDAYIAGSATADVSSGSFQQGETFQFGGTGTIVYQENTAVNTGDILWAIDNVYTVTSGGTTGANIPTHTTGTVTNGTADLEFLRSAYEFTAVTIKSIRAEGEVVETGTDYSTTLPISRIDFSIQGTAEVAQNGFGSDVEGNAEDLGGVVFYTNALVGSTNIHPFKEGQEVLIEGLPADLSMLNGKQRIYKILEDADGRSRRFVIPKKIPSSLGYNSNSNYQPALATVRGASAYVTVSLLNSPNKFERANYVSRRYQDACNLIRNNIDFIKDEVVLKINNQFAIKHLVVESVDSSTNTFAVRTAPNEFTHTYVSGGKVTYEGVEYTVNGFTYDNTTGLGTITTTSAVADLKDGHTVKVEDLVISCVQGQKIYPGFNIPNGDSKCYRDVGHFVNAILQDLEYGSNTYTIEAAKLYLNNARVDYVDNEIIQTVRAFEYARQLMVLAMRNWITGDGTSDNPEYVPEYSAVSRYKDTTVINTTAGTPVCADVEASINTLIYLFVDVLANNASGTYLDAAYLVARNANLIADQSLRDAQAFYPSLKLDATRSFKCKRDIRKVLSGLVRDLVLGGNAGIVDSAESYYTGQALSGIPEAQLGGTIYAFRQARKYARQAMRNWTNGNYVDLTPSNATYNSTSGELTVSFTTPSTPIVAGVTRIAFKEGALTFNCDMGGGLAAHASPTPTDRNYGKSNIITNVSEAGGVTTITTNVGNAGTAAGVAHTFASALANGTIIVWDEIDIASPIPRFEDWNILVDPVSVASKLITPSDASYDPATGLFTITATNHGVLGTDSIRIAPQSFTFTCAMDGNKTEHYLPGAGQTAFDSDLAVNVVDANTFTVNVGASAANQSWTPTDAIYNPATGELELTIGSGHGLYVGAGITVDDESLSFTCTMDGNDSTESYPRPGIDPYAGRSMPISAVSENTITVNAGKSAPNKYFQPSSANYNAVTGDLTIDIGQHGLGEGRHVVLEDNSFTFTCDLDGNVEQKTYPRPGIDPYAGKTIEINTVQTTSHTPTLAAYDTEIGVVTLTINGHNFNEGDYVKIADGSLTFSCQPEGTSSPVNKSYPRAGYDYPSGRWLPIKNVTTNTFDIEVGPSAYNQPHTFISASANSVERQTGIIIINVGPSAVGQQHVHTFISATATAVQHLPQSVHTFVGATSGAIKHEPQSAHTFVRTQNNSISVYGAGAFPACNNVANSINTSMNLLEDILDGTIAPGATAKTYGTLYQTSAIETKASSTIYDENNALVTPITMWDDLPIIEASPYTQNASVISFLGGGGAEIDGSKVAQPNCPKPGLTLTGAAVTPNQGKSMVAAAFTIITFGGTGYKVINDGYTQLVSVFVIFAENGVLAESGGYASITNSATNFGTFALRARGFREEAYEFDAGFRTGGGVYTRAQITSVSATPAGRSIINVENLGRRALEHYILKIDGYRNADESKEYFIETVAGGSVGPPFTCQLTLDDGVGNSLSVVDENTNQVIAATNLVTYHQSTYGNNPNIRLHRPSIVNSSSHTWEFAGSGTNYNALPENGGVKVEANEQVSEDYGRVYVSGTDELGDFKVGTFAKIENRTGAITFTGTVTISEVEFLKLKGGDVVVTGFDASNTLGGANASDSKIPTEKAVKDYITNNLGPYINKPYSTNSVARALVELGDDGKISLDQIPALRPFNVYTVADAAERVSPNTVYGDNGPLAGDIVIQSSPQKSFILNNDTDSQFLGFNVDSNLDFTINDVYQARDSGGALKLGKSQVQATEYREGVLYKVNITNNGSGYTTTPNVTINNVGGVPTQAADIQATIVNGQVTTLEIVLFNGYVGGYGYTQAPGITIDAPGGAGTQATADAFIESRLYADIINNVKMEDVDFINDDNGTTVDITRVYNTSYTKLDGSGEGINWVALSDNQIDAADIQSGTIATSRLGFNSDAANSQTFLRGDRTYAKVLQSVKKTETRYFAVTSQQSLANSNTLFFTTNSEVLKGHEVDNTNVTQIQDDTLIQSVNTELGTTTVTLDKSITSDIPAGTEIQFGRGSSPLLIESSDTGGEFVEEVVVLQGGSGYTDGVGGVPYVDLSLPGGGGTGLKVNITVVGGAVTEVVVADGGQGYSAGDFTVSGSNIPSDIGPGNGAIFAVKLGSETRHYGNSTIDILRATDQTTSQDAYGTVGVARFKKSQFNIGDDGNGSIELKTGDGSGLDADFLDGFSGSHYTNAGSLTSGVLGLDRLSGTYNISISGQSGSALVIGSDTGGANTRTNPDDTVPGLELELKNNVKATLPGEPDDNLEDGGTKHLVMNLRNGGNGTNSTFGGARQLGFTDNGNMWIRHTSGSDMAGDWGTWYKIWHSNNDGPDTGMDADKLDNKQGKWYQSAYNMNYGVLSQRRIPEYLDSTSVKNELVVRGVKQEDYYEIYVPGQILTGAPWIDPNTQSFNQNINFYDISGIATGTTFAITNIITNDEVPVPPAALEDEDTAGDYTILVGRASDAIGNARKIGSASTNVEFVEYTLILPSGNDTNQNIYEAAKLTEDSQLILGRIDDTAVDSSILFRTHSTTAKSGSTPTYDSKIEASGGNGTTGKGSINVVVATNDSFTINGNTVFNAGNLSFSSNGTGNSLVQYDANGNFSANEITATLIGSASENLLLTGGTIDGNLNVGTNTTARLLTVTGDVDVTNTLDVEGQFRVDSTNNLIYADQANGNVLVGTSPASTPSLNGKLNVYTTGNDFRNALTIRTGTNEHEQGIAFQNGGYAYTWNIFRAPSDYGTNNPATTSLADLYFNGASGSGAESDLGNLSTSLLLRAGGDIETGTGKVGIGQSPLDSVYKLSVFGQVHTEDPSAVSYNDQDSYLVFFNDKEVEYLDTNGNALYNPMNSFVCEKTGSVRVKWASYIQSGSYWYAFRFTKNGTELFNAPYSSVTYLDGNSSAVHSYRNFSAVIEDVKPGDVISFEMVSSTSGGTPVNGTGTQNLYCKNFRVYSGTPHHANPHGGNTFIGDRQIGIGTGLFINQNDANIVYGLNVDGNVNFNGTLYQNDNEFVTSRWTETGNHIYRNSRVGIGETTPAYTLDVGEDFTDTGESGRLRVQGTSRLEGAVTITTGGADVTGAINAKDGLQANGNVQWLDSKGIIKSHIVIIDEDVTIPAGTNGFSVGDVTVANGRTITVNGVWKIL